MQARHFAIICSQKGKITMRIINNIDRISEPVVTKFADKKSQPVVTKLIKDPPFDLPRTHYMILMCIEDAAARKFYEI